MQRDFIIHAVAMAGADESLHAHKQLIKQPRKIFVCIRARVMKSLR